MSFFGNLREGRVNRWLLGRGALLLVLALLCLPSAGRAATFNVTTASDADCSDLDCDLQSALLAAQMDGQSDIIRVAQGTYTGNFAYAAQPGENYDITLEGGWSAGFSSRTLDPTNTILDGNNTGRVLLIDNRAKTTNGSIKVEGFTLRNGLISGKHGGGLLASSYPPGGIELNTNIFENNQTPTGNGAGFMIYSHDGPTSSGGPLVVSDNIVRNNTAGPANSFGGGAFIYCANTCLIVNNLVHGNNAASTVLGQGQGGGLVVVGLAGTIDMINNTITGNHAHTFGGGVSLATYSSTWANAAFRLYNNVVRGNTYTVGWLGDQDIFNSVSATIPSTGNSLLFSHNNYQYYAPWPSPAAKTPTFDSNKNASCFVGGGNYHLAAGTQCIDTGENTAPSLPYADLDGYARICDGDGNGSDIVDMGAYEYGACATTAAEICDNCIDDDGDGQIDRDDPDCPARADGGGEGLNDPKARGKAVVKCESKVKKAGAKFVAKKLKGLQKCVDAVFKCLQQKPGDQECLDKAKEKCAKEVAKIRAGDKSEEEKLVAGIKKGCGPKKDGEPPQVSSADGMGVKGLGYDAEVAQCAGFGVTLVWGPEHGECVKRQHECRVEQILSKEVPRVKELLAYGGIAPNDFPCLESAADGGGQGLGDPKVEGKALVKCQTAIKKAGGKFVANKLKIIHKCVNAVYACLQKKPGDVECLDKAKAKCAKEVGKLTEPDKGVEAKLVAAILKACDKAELGLSALLAETGLGFSVHEDQCKGLGVDPLASVGDIAECIKRQHECRVEQLAEKEVPRLHELLGLGGVTLP